MIALMLLACGPGDWDVEDPPHYVYDDSKTPLVELPEDAATWDDLALPLEQTGGDNGDESLTYTFSLAAYYLLRVQNQGIGSPAGLEYQPETGEWTDDDSLGRQLMAVISLVRAFDVTGRSEFEVGARHGIRAHLEDIEVLEDGSWKRTSMGGTVLLTIAMTEHARLTGAVDWNAAIDGFGAYVLSQIDSEGRMAEGASRLQAQQAHKALWNLWSHTQDAAYLDALEVLGHYHYENRDDTDDLFEYPYLYGLWAAEPLVSLYSLRPADWIPELLFYVGDEVVAKQWTPLNTREEERLGGFYANPPNEDGPPNWSHTLKLEATADCWRMAQAVFDTERMRTYRRAAILGAQYMQRWQYRAGEMAGFDEPGFALGGLSLYDDDPSIRLDIPAHGGVAIMKVAGYLELESWPGAYPVP